MCGEVLVSGAGQEIGTLTLLAVGAKRSLMSVRSKEFLFPQTVVDGDEVTLLESTRSLMPKAP